MGQYSLFDDPKDGANKELDGSMKTWAMNLGMMGTYEYRAGNAVGLNEGETLVASTILNKEVKVPGYQTKTYNMGDRPKTLHAFRISVIENANQSSYAKCEYMYSDQKIGGNKVEAFFRELPMHLLESRTLSAVNQFASDFWHKYKTEPKKEIVQSPPTISRNASLEEKIISEKLPRVMDLHGKETGWSTFEKRNGGNQLVCITLISKDGEYAVDFVNSRIGTGHGNYQVQASAQAYAIDHDYSDVMPEHDYEGFSVYPRLLQSGELRYGVQSLDNLHKGEKQRFGNHLFKTIDDAHRNAKIQKVELDDRSQIAQIEDQASEAQEAKKSANRVLSISDRRANSVLDKPANYLNVGLLNGTRRESIDLAVTKGLEFIEKSVFDDAGQKRDEKIMDKVRNRGYILGLSNENLPLVKEGLAAKQRLAENTYQKSEYRLYLPNVEAGRFVEITKTEFDYAIRVKAMRIENIQKTPEPRKSIER